MTSTGISFHTETVEILAGSTASDRYGNTATDWTDPSVRRVSGCRLDPVPSTEILERVTRRWVLYAPPDTPLTAYSRVRWRGVVYDVTGEVRRWESPTGRLAHIEADLERVEG
jgi:hypothetical protein